MCKERKIVFPGKRKNILNTAKIELENREIKQNSKRDNMHLLNRPEILEEMEEIK